ncbi:MAG: hypothetical protein FDX18_01780 [Chlorobium sp.]|nr:MAG: hypothetical protein FDX18_01780 [Chlorobium sp.]
MNQSLKSFASWSLLLLILIQFIPLNRINQPALSDFNAPFTIKSSLKKACYDCHSNETRWTRVAYIAPISWLVSGTVASGRNILNFSMRSNKKTTETILQSLKIRKIIAEGHSHQHLYYFWKPEAQLTEQERETILHWLDSSEKNTL